MADASFLCKWLKILFIADKGGGVVKRMQLQLINNLLYRLPLHGKLLKHGVECHLILCPMIVSTFQVLVAVNRAVRALRRKSMTTRSVYAEIIFNLSPTKSITDSLKRFGLGDDDQNILAVVIDESDISTLVDKLNSQVKGQICMLEEINMLTDEENIIKTYKMKSSEIQKGNIEDSVISRMACKDFLVMN
ncbi:unnamed protein product, partial [Meganyctiphanes norvegica]